MVEETKFNSMNNYVESSTQISYDNIPQAEKTTGVIEVNSNFKAPGSDINHEEINDYSFLNVLTEEITSLDANNITDNLLDVLKNSFSDIDNKTKPNYILDSNFIKLVNNLNPAEHTALLHNVEDTSYLEIINHIDNSSYTLQFHHDGCTILNSGMEHFLSHIIDTTSHS